MRRALLILVVCTGVCWPAAAAQASASAQPAAIPAGPTTDVNLPLYIVGPGSTPPGFRIDSNQAALVARTSPTMQAIHRAHHPLNLRVWVLLGAHYEVYFSFHGKLVGDVLVARGGRLGPTYTGPLMLGFYARGHYGDVFDSPWVFLPFGLMFLLPIVRLRGGSWLDRLDLGVVLTFGVSYVLFDHARLEPAVWLAYPPLIYLLARMLFRGFRPRAARTPLDSGLPVWLLAGGLVALVAARIVVTLLPAHVMDVGTASAIGAYKILHGQSLYFASTGHPDTYGPIAYLAYVPFEAIWPRAWSYLPSVRAATITFDLLTIGGLVLIGMRLRAGSAGRRLGLLLGWLWAACPFTLLGLVKSTNDGLVALLLVAVMLSMTRPIRRGALLGLAAAAKFFPALLLPLVAAGRGKAKQGDAQRVLAGFVIASAASVALFLPPGGIKEIWKHTIGFQLTRPDVFSPWALHPGLAPVKVAIEVGVGLLALVVAFRPRGARTTSQVSALAAALVIAVQLPALHWFYLYIVWFMPLVLIAVLGVDAEARPTPRAAVVAEPESEDDQRTPTLVGAG
jgi:Glycosyltransferase family 87